jgi:hypothetical protein
MADNSKKVQEDLASVKALDKMLTQTLDNRLKGAKEANALQDELLRKLRDQKDISEDLIDDINTYEEMMSDVLDSNTKGGDALKSQLDIIKGILKQEEARKIADEKIGGALNNQVDALQDKIKSFPILGDKLAKSINFDKIKEGATQMTSKFTNAFTEASMSGKGFAGSLGTALKSVSKGLNLATIKQAAFNATAMINPYVAIAAAVLALIVLMRKLQKSALAINQETVDMSRDMGIANSQAEEMYSNFNRTAIASNNLNMSAKNLVQAQKELASSIGMTAEYSAGMLQDQIHLTKYMGMSGDQAANFQKIAASSGQSTREMQREVAGTVQALNDATGMSIDFAGVMRDIADLTPQMRARFRGNTKELALAVAEAKALGTTLQESSDAAQNLLNMESSLQAEMKARMLTGVNINNDEIRRAQLMGDQAKVLELQAKQMNEIGDVSKMLPHEQKAIADAMGMSVDQMLKMNEQQQMLNKLGVKSLDNLSKQDLINKGMDARKAEELIREREKQSLQEKQNALMGKLTAMWNEIASVLIPIISYLVDLIMPTVEYIFGQVANIFKVFEAIGDILRGDFKEGFTKIGEVVLETLLAPFKWVWNTVKSLFGMGGDSTGYDEGMSESDSIDDGVITPTGEVIKTNPMDYIMAVKNPFDMLGGLFGGGSSGGGSIDYDKLAAAISNQPLQIVIDGRVISEITRKQGVNQSFNKQMG